MSTPSRDPPSRWQSKFPKASSQQALSLPPPPPPIPPSLAAAGPLFMPSAGVLLQSAPPPPQHHPHHNHNHNHCNPAPADAGHAAVAVRHPGTSSLVPLVHGPAAGSGSITIGGGGSAHGPGQGRPPHATHAHVPPGEAFHVWCAEQAAHRSLRSDVVRDAAELCHGTKRDDLAAKTCWDGGSMNNGAVNGVAVADYVQRPVDLRRHAADSNRLDGATFPVVRLAPPPHLTLEVLDRPPTVSTTTSANPSATGPSAVAAEDGIDAGVAEFVVGRVTDHVTYTGALLADVSFVAATVDAPSPPRSGAPHNHGGYLAASRLFAAPPPTTNGNGDHSDDTGSDSPVGGAVGAVLILGGGEEARGTQGHSALHLFIHKGSLPRAVLLEGSVEGSPYGPLMVAYRTRATMTLAVRDASVMVMAAGGQSADTAGALLASPPTTIAVDVVYHTQRVRPAVQQQPQAVLDSPHAQSGSVPRHRRAHKAGPPGGQPLTTLPLSGRHRLLPEVGASSNHSTITTTTQAQAQRSPRLAPADGAARSEAPVGVAMRQHQREERLATQRRALAAVAAPLTLPPSEAALFEALRQPLLPPSEGCTTPGVDDDDTAVDFASRLPRSPINLCFQSELVSALADPSDAAAKERSEAGIERIRWLGRALFRNFPLIFLRMGPWAHERRTLLFHATATFAAPCLEALSAAGHAVTNVPPQSLDGSDVASVTTEALLESALEAIMPWTTAAANESSPPIVVTSATPNAMLEETWRCDARLLQCCRRLFADWASEEGDTSATGVGLLQQCNGLTDARVRLWRHTQQRARGSSGGDGRTEPSPLTTLTLALGLGAALTDRGLLRKHTGRFGEAVTDFSAAHGAFAAASATAQAMRSASMPVLLQALFTTRLLEGECTMCADPGSAHVVAAFDGAAAYAERGSQEALTRHHTRLLAVGPADDSEALERTVDVSEVQRWDRAASEAAVLTTFAATYAGDRSGDPLAGGRAQSPGPLTTRSAPDSSPHSAQNRTASAARSPHAVPLAMEQLLFSAAAAALSDHTAQALNDAARLFEFCDGQQEGARRDMVPEAALLLRSAAHMIAAMACDGALLRDEGQSAGADGVSDGADGDDFAAMRSHHLNEAVRCVTLCARLGEGHAAACPPVTLQACFQESRPTLSKRRSIVAETVSALSRRVSALDHAAQITKSVFSQHHIFAAVLRAAAAAAAAEDIQALTVASVASARNGAIGRQGRLRERLLSGGDGGLGSLLKHAAAPVPPVPATAAAVPRGALLFGVRREARVFAYMWEVVSYALLQCGAARDALVASAAAVRCWVAPTPSEEGGRAATAASPRGNSPLRYRTDRDGGGLIWRRDARAARRLLVLGSQVCGAAALACSWRSSAAQETIGRRSCTLDSATQSKSIDYTTITEHDRCGAGGASVALAADLDAMAAFADVTTAEAGQQSHGVLRADLHTVQAAADMLLVCASVLAAVGSEPQRHQARDYLQMAQNLLLSCLRTADHRSLLAVVAGDMLAPARDMSPALLRQRAQWVAQRGGPGNAATPGLALLVLALGAVHEERFREEARSASAGRGSSRCAFTASMAMHLTRSHFTFRQAVALFELCEDRPSTAHAEALVGAARTTVMLAGLEESLLRHRFGSLAAHLRQQKPPFSYQHQHSTRSRRRCVSRSRGEKGTWSDLEEEGENSLSISPPRAAAPAPAARSGAPPSAGGPCRREASGPIGALVPHWAKTVDLAFAPGPATGAYSQRLEVDTVAGLALGEPSVGHHHRATLPIDLVDAAAFVAAARGVMDLIFTSQRAVACASHLPSVCVYRGLLSVDGAIGAWAKSHGLHWFVDPHEDGCT